MPDNLQGPFLHHSEPNKEEFCNNCVLSARSAPPATACAASTAASHSSLNFLVMATDFCKLPEVYSTSKSTRGALPKGSVRTCETSPGNHKERISTCPAAALKPPTQPRFVSRGLTGFQFPEKTKLPYGMHSIDITSATWKSSSSNPPPPSQRGQMQTHFSELFKFYLCCIYFK